MSAPRTAEFNVHFARGAAGALELREGTPPPPPIVDLVPRVARLMALAIRLRRSAGNGAVGADARAAGAAGVTRARVAQIVGLLWLAPDIQEEILFLQLAAPGRERFTERCLRPIAAEVCWRRQRQMWRALRSENRGARAQSERPAPAAGVGSACRDARKGAASGKGRAESRGRDGPIGDGADRIQGSL